MAPVWAGDPETIGKDGLGQTAVKRVRKKHRGRVTDRASWVPKRRVSRFVRYVRYVPCAGSQGK